MGSLTPIFCIVILLLGISSTRGTEEEPVPLKIVKNYYPKKYQIVKKASTTVEPKEELTTMQSTETTISSEPILKDLTLNEQEFLNAMSRAKKSAKLSFCVEIKPSNPYQKPFQICESSDNGYQYHPKHPVPQKPHPGYGKGYGEQPKPQPKPQPGYGGPKEGYEPEAPQPNPCPGYGRSYGGQEGSYAPKPSYGGGYGGQPAYKPSYGGQPAYKPSYGGQPTYKPSYGGGYGGQPAHKPSYGGGYGGQPAHKPSYGGGYGGQPAHRPSYGGAMVLPHVPVAQPYHVHSKPSYKPSYNGGGSTYRDNTIAEDPTMQERTAYYGSYDPYESEKEEIKEYAPAANYGYHETTPIKIVKAPTYYRPSYGHQSTGSVSALQEYGMQHQPEASQIDLLKNLYGSPEKAYGPSSSIGESAGYGSPVLYRTASGDWKIMEEEPIERSSGGWKGVEMEEKSSGGGKIRDGEPMERSKHGGWVTEERKSKGEKYLDNVEMSMKEADIAQQTFA